MSRFVPNSTMVPNAFFDEVMQHLSEKALRAYLIIARKTTGWGKEWDAISISQFKALTGMRDERTIRAGLNELIRYRLIRPIDRPGHPTKYALNHQADFSDLSTAPLHEMHPLHEMQGDPLHGVQGDPLHDVQGDPLHDVHPTKEIYKTTNKNKNKSPNGDLQKAGEKLGQRLALDALPEAWRKFCHDERPGLNADWVFARFRDYWIAQPGAKGRKLDWFATWRNWVRNENGVSNGAHQLSGQQRKLSAVELVQQASRRYEDAERRRGEKTVGPAD